jgi:hypothetical protein
MAFAIEAAAKYGSLGKHPACRSHSYTKIEQGRKPAMLERFINSSVTNVIKKPAEI